MDGCWEKEKMIAIQITVGNQYLILAITELV
jgi:hypothetical protein